MLSCAGPVRLSAAETAAVGEAWQLISGHLASEAAAGLQKTSRPGDREWRLAEATARLEQMPLTAGRLAAAAGVFEELAQGDDEVAATAGYLLGRVYQVHLLQPDPVRAAQQFETLAARQPASPWAQLGLVKLALLQLYVLPQPARPAARITAAEALLPRVTDPDLRRNLHLVLGRASHFYRRPLPEVLAHLVAADGDQPGDELWRSELHVQIGELALRAEQLELAQKYFERFIARNSVDPRVFDARNKLAEIAQKRGHLPPEAAR